MEGEGQDETGDGLQAVGKGKGQAGMGDRTWEGEGWEDQQGSRAMTRFPARGPRAWWHHSREGHRARGQQARTRQERKAPGCPEPAALREDRPRAPSGPSLTDSQELSTPFMLASGWWGPLGRHGPRQ